MKKAIAFLLLLCACSAPSFAAFPPIAKPALLNDVYVEGEVWAVYLSPGLGALEVAVEGGDVVRLDCGAIDCSSVAVGARVEARGNLHGYISCRHDGLDVSVVLTRLAIIVE